MTGTNLQRYLSEALKNRGRTETWQAYLLEKRERGLSWISMSCEVYKETDLVIEATTLKRWTGAASKFRSFEPQGG